MARDGIAISYFAWLCKRVSVDKRYTRLCIRLHQTPFVVMNEKDGNRVSDGLYLRKKFEDETGFKIDGSVVDGPCTVLELLVALAMRCENDIMRDPDKDDQTHKWFWEMVYNLGLDAFDDERYDGSKIDDILLKWMSLKYTKRGLGSPFPLAVGVKTDQRKVEIWYQLQGYLTKNYEI